MLRTGDHTVLAAQRVNDSVAGKLRLLDGDCLATIVAAAGMISDAFATGNKLLIFGNGGSAADAQHIAGELVGRFLLERRALPAIALSVNAPTITAIANDYAFEHVFSRQVQALGQRDDVALGISTSGNSENVVAGLSAARAQGLRTLALTGAGGGRVAEGCDIAIRVPSDETPRIQESHLLAAHIICEIVELEVARGG